MAEGSRFLDGNGTVFESLHEIAQRLDGLGIPYAVVGGMALFQHGVRRFTDDIDILVTKENLKTIHSRLSGLGYLPPHRFSKHLKDTRRQVRIEFITTGEYPGDGLEKPVAFPDPEAVSVEIDGVRYVDLRTLIELKLASGSTGKDREKDLVDVQALIKALDLPRDFAEKLDPSVRGVFMDRWSRERRQFVTLWRNKWVTSEAKSLEDMEALLRGAANRLQSMLADGVRLRNVDGVRDDYAYLVTDDAEVAKRYDMVEESEFWNPEEE